MLELLCYTHLWPPLLVLCLFGAVMWSMYLKFMELDEEETMLAGVQRTCIMLVFLFLCWAVFVKRGGQAYTVVNHHVVQSFQVTKVCKARRRQGIHHWYWNN